MEDSTHETYRFVGVLEGRYYDKQGRRTQAWLDALAKARIADEQKRMQKELEKKFPNCNSKWEQGVGTTIWCTNDLIKPAGHNLVPRMSRSEELGSRCACMEYEVVKDDKTRYREYDGCSSESQTCFIAVRNQTKTAKPG